MNGRGDYPGEMGEVLIDDAGIEALLGGRPPAGEPELAAVAAFVREMQAAAFQPAPVPSPALAALLREGAAEAQIAAAPTVPAGRRPALGWRRRLAVVGIGLGVTITSVVGAGAAGLLPQPVEDAVGGVVEVLTPLEMPPRRSDTGTTGRDRPGGRGTTPAVPGGHSGDGGPAGSTPQQGPAVSGPRSGSVGPAPTGTVGSTTTTTRPPSGATTTITTPGLQVPPVPLPTVPSTLPELPPLPEPTLPNPGATPPRASQNPPISLPRMPW